MGRVLEESRVGMGRGSGYIDAREGHKVTHSVGVRLGVPVDEPGVLGSQSSRCWERV